MQAIIEVDNCYSYLKTGAEHIKKKLWNALRFRDKNYFHSRLYKQHLWDGYNEFFKLETGRFLTGLLPEVQEALKLWGVEYTLNDKRTPVKFQIENIDKSYFGKKIELYDYQVELINQAILFQRGIIKAPTSAGKSLIITAILKALPDTCPVLVLTKNVTLVRQIYDDMVKHKVPNCGVVYGDIFEPNIKMAINIASIHKIEKLLPKFKAILVDEVHLMMSKLPKNAYAKMKQATVRIGVSATPFKWDGQDKTQKFSVKGWFGPVLEVASAAEDGKSTGVLTTEKLQKRKILSSSNCTFYHINSPKLDWYTYQDAVTYGIAENFKFHETVAKLTSTLKGRSLVLVQRLAHGDMLSSLIPNSDWIRGETDEDIRKIVIEKLKYDKGNLVTIATTGIFNAGVNFFIHNLINAAGGKAEHDIIQRMGRGLRTAEDKSSLNYYDFYFTINEYLQKHSDNRIKILKKEGHNVIVKEEIDF